MNKLILLLCFCFAFTSSCQKKINNENIMNTNIAKVNDSTKLIDGITIDNSIFNKNDIDINTYKYNGIYLENLKLKDLLDKDYRANLLSI